MIVKDPLKNLVTGKFKEDARQKKRVKLLLHIRQNEKTHFTTEDLAQKVFAGKLDTANVSKLLKDIEETGLIKGVVSRDQDVRKTKWIYQKQQ